MEDGAQPVVEDVFNWDEEEDAEPRVLTREQPFGTAAVQQALQQSRAAGAAATGGSTCAAV